MANVLIQKDGKLEYLESVNTGDYVLDANVPKDQVQPIAGVLINPDISSVKDLPTKYWKLQDSKLAPMTRQEQALVDADEKQKVLDSIDLTSIDVRDLAHALIDIGVITKKQIIDKVKEARNGNN